MIKIIKDNNVKEVTKGAYNSFYKRLGYTVLTKTNKIEKDNRNKKVDNVSDKQEDIEDKENKQEDIADKENKQEDKKRK